MAFHDQPRDNPRAGPHGGPRAGTDDLLADLRLPHLGRGFVSFLFDDRLLYEGIVSRRVFAYLVDLAILGLLTVAAYLVVFVFGLLSFGLLLPVGFVAIALLPLAYHSLFLAYWGASPGMALFDLECRAPDGGRPTLFQAAVRTALFLVSVPATAGLVLVVALLNDRGRTLHDFLSGMLVVRSAHFASKTLR
ncbi:MAG: RDD family protein [Tistlia sp.]|uniref:RDD family protein n=1 Tax=Tistlia sp. TaxID=3057121 RepID=UPI0034A44828